MEKENINLKNYAIAISNNLIWIKSNALQTDIIKLLLDSLQEIVSNKENKISLDSYSKIEKNLKMVYELKVQVDENEKKLVKYEVDNNEVTDETNQNN